MPNGTWEERHTLRVPLPATDAEKTAYEEWEKAVGKLLKQGRKRGWLDYEDLDFHGPQAPGCETRLETDEEYERRLNNPWAKANWFMSQRYVETLNRLLVNVAASGVPDGFVTFPVITPETSDAD